VLKGRRKFGGKVHPYLENLFCSGIVCMVVELMANLPSVCVYYYLSRINFSLEVTTLRILYLL